MAANTSHPGNDYYVNAVTGTIQQQSNSILATGLKALGFVGPMTYADAQAVAQIGASQAARSTPAGTAAQTGANIANATNLGSWLTGLGGDIGSGLEAGLVSFLNDLWGIILGPLEIIAGVVLAIVILLYAFKDDMFAIAGLMGM